MADDILVRDHMMGQFVSLSSNLSVKTAFQQMQKAKTTYGLVLKGEGDPQSLLTGERLLTLQQTLGTEAKTISITDAADAFVPALFVSDDLPLEEVLEWPRLKELTDVDSALICMHNQKPVGILSSASLLEYGVIAGQASTSRFGFNMLLPGTTTTRLLEVVCTVCQTKNKVIRVDSNLFCSNDKRPYGLHHLKI